MRVTKLVASCAFLVASLFGASWSSAQTRHACLSIKAGSTQGLPAMFFAAKKKLDADVQKCIEGKLSGGALKDDGLTVKVSGGEAVLTGETRTPGHKGNASQFARGCGAQEVTNNIIITRNPPVH